MGNFHGEHLSVAKALYQLEFYLDQLNAPFDIYHLYATAYKEQRGSQYDERWLYCLDDNPEVENCLDEGFTLQTIVDTLLRTGHEPVVRALMRSFRREKIAISQLYLIGATPRRRN
ncbi:hypothetical protein [Alicyclobacillus dauci]|uniref:Uncharacterized protein n=1 Tax=Alicyclobacillus dauci TaxID=1475485 RepID=A0ABY6YY47_9BACL|nr:hypothetical protein [Alicyclobacillus dauci]WAH35347.1 hypothetical protein NZD86_13675 [Alicyclobacillus dauci]